MMTPSAQKDAPPGGGTRRASQQVSSSTDRTCRQQHILAEVAQTDSNAQKTKLFFTFVLDNKEDEPTRVH